MTTLPVRKLSAVSPASSGSTPKTFALGRRRLTAVATPLSRPPPETGARTRSTSGRCFDDFEAAGGLAGDDLLVVVGRDDDVAVLAHEFFGLGEALAGGDADVDDFGAEGERGGALDGGGVRGHDDDGLGADFAGGVGDALGVVAAGVGDDAAGDFFGRELEDLVGRAADFEAADGLQAFGLEPDLLRAVTGDVGEVGADERGLDGDVGDASGGGADGVERDERISCDAHGRYFSGTGFGRGLGLPDDFDYVPLLAVEDGLDAVDAAIEHFAFGRLAIGVVRVS